MERNCSDITANLSCIVFSYFPAARRTDKKTVSYEEILSFAVNTREMKYVKCRYNLNYISLVPELSVSSLYIEPGARRDSLGKKTIGYLNARILQTYFIILFPVELFLSKRNFLFVCW